MRLMYFAMGGVYPFNIGGTSTVAYNLLRHFDKIDIDINFVFVILESNVPKEGFHKYFGVSDNVTFHPIIKAKYDLQIIQGCLGSLRLINLVKKINPDIIHYNLFPSKRESLIPWVGRLRKIPQVYTYHGRFWKEVRENYPPPFSFIIKQQFKIYRNFYSSIVINYMKMIKNVIIEEFDQDRVIYIPNGIDLQMFKTAKSIELEGDPAILYVGRLEDVKGVDILINAFNNLSNTLKNAKLHILGSGSKQEDLKRMVDSLKIHDKVLFHGFRKDVGSFYKGADICVFPSHYEAAPLVRLEAMANKCPMICSDKGGVREIVNNKENGILISPSVDDIVSEVINLWKNEELRKKIITNAYRTVQDYSWDKIVKQYVKMYEELVDNKKNSHKNRLFTDY